MVGVAQVWVKGLAPRKPDARDQRQVAMVVGGEIVGGEVIRGLTLLSVVGGASRRRGEPARRAAASPPSSQAQRSIE